jgi:hypothetical protein
METTFPSDANLTHEEVEKLFAINCFKALMKSNLELLSDFQDMILEIAVQYHKEDRISLEFLKEINNVD